MAKSNMGLAVTLSHRNTTSYFAHSPLCMKIESGEPLAGRFVFLFLRALAVLRIDFCRRPPIQVVLAGLVAGKGRRTCQRTISFTLKYATNRAL
jgi:hypothetical protein